LGLAGCPNSNGHRDATTVLLAYRHGLRPIELVTLRTVRRFPIAAERTKKSVNHLM
jgi:hypothetical protein